MSGDVEQQVEHLLLNQRIVDLESAYGRCLDGDRLEEWPDLFVEDGVYKIIPRENADRGLPVALISCSSKAQLRDRVVLLREALVYTRRLDRHLIGNVRVVGEQDGAHLVAANYVVHVTDILEGTTQLFSAGRYEDKVVFVDGAPKFKEKIVIADTFSVTNNISTPL